MQALSFQLDIQNVTSNVYAIIGETGQRSPENLGNNATFGFVVTDEGVLLVDPGGSYKGAARIEAAIRTVTDKPVKIVINTGGQDHRFLGNGYFKERGAHIIASQEAVTDHKDRTNAHFEALEFLVGKEGLEGTEAVYADQTFEETLELTFGGHLFQLVYAGPAHTPGDIFVFMPDKNVMFTGDIVYVERTLGIGPADNAKSWISAFEAMAANNPGHIIPGHGPVTTLKRATAETYDYLINLRREIGKVIESGGLIEDGIAVDQSRFSHLKVFDQIARRNAQAVFMQMEFE